MNISLEIHQTSVSAQVNFSNSAEAATAASRLNNMNWKSMVLNARVDSIGLVDANVDRLQSRTVKISWDIAMISAWAFYDTISTAKSEAAGLDGSIFQGRKIKACFQSRLRRNQTHSFGVQIEGLPADTDRVALEQVCSAASSVTMSRPTYVGSPVEHIRHLLGQFGGMDALDIIPGDKAQTKNLAFTRFQTREAAATAVDSLKGVSQKFLGDTPLSVQHVYSVRYTMAAQAFAAVEKELGRLRESQDPNCKIRHYESDIGRELVHVRAFGAGPSFLTPLQADLEKLVLGELLTEDGENVWDDFFDLPISGDQVSRIGQKHGSFVMCDFRTCTVRVFGDQISRERTKKSIRVLLKNVHNLQRAIPLEKDSLCALLSGGLDAVTADVKVHQVSLDLISRTLTVRGDPEIHNKVLNIMDTYTSALSNAHDGDVCSLCSLPQSDMVKLSCRHIYCKTCLQLFLRSMIGPKFAHLTCLVETQDQNSDKSIPCLGDITYTTIRDMLSRDEERDLLESSFLVYVRANLQDFRYCPTPHCQVVYRPGVDGTVFRCLSCHSWICSSCHVGFHEGLTCAEHRGNTISYTEANEETSKDK